MIYTTKPAEFNPVVEVVGCFMEHDGAFLLLQRNEEKSEPLAWGIPSGKLESSDIDLVTAVQREVSEETGIFLPAEKLNFVSTVYVKYDSHDLVYHMFQTIHDEAPEVLLSDEHVAYCWKTPETAAEIDLMIDLEPCISLAYSNRV